MDVLIAESQCPPYKSLAVVKPAQVKDFIWEEVDRNWNPERLKAVYANQMQGDLFMQEDERVAFNIAKKLPYKFSYVFTTEDGKERTLMIEDWELGMLYWNCLEAANGDEQIACQKVKEMYFNKMVQGKDFYFLLGTTLKHHIGSPNPFIIIGTFYPKKSEPELPLFKWGYISSLYVTKDIKVGEVITKQNVRSIRPGFGLHPKCLKDLLGKKVNRDLTKGTSMKLEYVE